MKILKKIISIICVLSFIITPLGSLSVRAEEIKTAEEIYTRALESEVASDLSETIKTYLEGYDLYPEDVRFQEYIIEHLEEVLDWCKKKEEEDLFKEALKGYQILLRIAEDQEEDSSFLSQENLVAFQEKIQILKEDKGLEDEAQKPQESKDVLKYSEEETQIEEKALKEEENIRKLELPNTEEEEIPLDVSQEKKSDLEKEELYNKAKDSPYASEKFSLYIEGYERYPEDNRFKEGIASSALNMLNLGIRHHRDGNFNSALEYYNTILNAPCVPQETVNRIYTYKKLAIKGEILLTEDELYKKAANSLYASEKFSLYIKGYELYPSDSRFKEGIENSASNMLDLGKRHHQEGNFSSALEYYNTILRAPALSQGMIDEITQYQRMAISGEYLLTAEELYKKAVNSPYASEKFSLYIKGYNLYPNDNRFKEGIASSALNMLDLGKRHQAQGNFSSAIEYYDVILNAPAVPQGTKDIVQANKNLIQGQELYNKAKNSPYASEKFSLYIQGYKLYPGDNRFKEGIASSALNMLNLGIRHHKEGNLNSAIEYYSTILKAPAVPQETVNKVYKYHALAIGGEYLPNAEKLYKMAVDSPYASEKFSLYIEGYELYPDDSRFIEGIASSALNMLDLGMRHHNEGNFVSAIEYYNTILNAPAVPKATLNKVKDLLILAQNGQIYNPLPLTGKTIILDIGHGGIDGGAHRSGINEKDLNLSMGLKLRDALVAQGATVITTRTTDKYVDLYDRAMIANKIIVERELSKAKNLGDKAKISDLQYKLQLIQQVLDNSHRVGTRENVGIVKAEQNSKGDYVIPKHLKEVFDIQKQYKDTIFLSLHNNASTSTTSRGTQVYVATNKTFTGKLQTPYLGYYNGYDDANRLKLANSIFNAMHGKLGLDGKNAGVYQDFHAVTRETNVVSAILEVGFISNPSELEILKQKTTHDKVAKYVTEGIINYFK